MSLTVHLLVNNNEQDIEQALQSLVALESPILIGDQGSTDNTLAICHKFKTKIIPVSAENCSIARNMLIDNTKTSWAFYIQPWEVLAQGHRYLLERSQGNSCLCQIFQDNVVSKEIRLWNISSGLKFINPVFETLYDPNANVLKEIIIYGKKRQVSFKKQLDIIRKWKREQPTSPNPYYYEACILLQQGNYQEFVSMANHYLFQEKEGMSAVMLKYYLAMIYCYQKDPKSALWHLLPCLAIRPIMSEFWCLLGDIYYQQNNFQKAAAFYENALILGGCRNLLDEWPIEINKYKSYPQKMIGSCLDVKKAKHYCHENKTTF